MAGGLGIACCMIIGALVIGVLIGAVILRCACWLYNKIVGAPGGPAAYRDGVDDDRPRRRLDAERYDDEDEEDDESGEEEDDRPRPRRRPAAYDPDGPGVPEPTMGKAMGIMVVDMIVGAGINFVIGFATGAGMRGFGGPAGGGAAANLGVVLFAQLLQLIVGFFLLAGLVTAMLPTRFGRACAVAGLFYVIGIAIAAVIIGVLVAVGVGMGAAGLFGR
jgi:hypothetical protein